MIVVVLAWLVGFGICVLIATLLFSHGLALLGIIWCLTCVGHWLAELSKVGSHG